MASKIKQLLLCHSTSTPTPSQNVTALMTVFKAAGFEGNVDDYYNLNNSLLLAAMDNRTGIPLTHAIICAEVAKLAGFQVDIIGLPGHIICASGVDEERVYFEVCDTSSDSPLLSFEDIIEIVSRYNIEFQEGMLRPIPEREVWSRILRNILNALIHQAALSVDNFLRLFISHTQRMIKCQ